MSLPPVRDDPEWIVRPVRGHDARKVYRCPGCDQEIALGQPHVVAWPTASLAGPDDRRHWHTACWRARHRGPTAKQRSSRR